jgi:inner membrane transporter RhtA
MVSLLPAIATVIGVVVLVQVPDVTEVTGVACVIAGVALHRESGGVIDSHDRSRGGVRSRLVPQLTREREA